MQHVNGLHDMLTYNIDSFKSWNWYRLEDNNESAWLHLVCSSSKASSINLTVQSHLPLPLLSVICITWYHPCALSGFTRFMTYDIIWVHILMEKHTVSVDIVHARLPGAGWSFVRRFMGLLLMPQKPLLNEKRPLLPTLIEALGEDWGKLPSSGYSQIAC